MRDLRATQTPSCCPAVTPLRTRVRTPAF